MSSDFGFKSCCVILRPYYREWSHWALAQQIRDISIVLLEIQSTSLAMQAMWNREEGWTTCAFNFEKYWLIISNSCIHIPLKNIIHTKLENSLSIRICRFIDPVARTNDSNGSAQCLQESSPLSWRLWECTRKREAKREREQEYWFEYEGEVEPLWWSLRFQEKQEKKFEKAKFSYCMRGFHLES